MTQAQRIVILLGMRSYLCAALLAVAAVAIADDMDNLAANLKEAQTALLKAKVAFRKTLPTLPEYQAAAANLAACQDEIGRLKQGHASDDEFKAAFKKKLDAEAELRKVADGLESTDSRVSKATEAVSKAQAKIDALQNEQDQAKKTAETEAAARKADAEKQRIIKARIYREIVDHVYKSAPPEPDKIPLDGKEISLSEPKANPKSFVNNPFVVCGNVKIDDDYRYGYLSTTHFSLALTAKTANNEVADYASIYIKRSIGNDLIDILAKRDKQWPNNPWIMRVKLTIDPEFINSPAQSSVRIMSLDQAYRQIQMDMTNNSGEKPIDAHGQYTLLDWQFLGPNGWSPWHSEVVGN